MNIRHYKKDAARQITLNSLACEGVLRIYEIVYNSVDSIFSEDEANEFRQEIVKRGIHTLELTNTPYREDSQLTKIKGFMNSFDVRYIDPNQVKYSTEVVIYNDVVAFYSYGKGGQGVEIEDAGYAQMQKQIFDALWRKASRPVIGKSGRSSLI